MAISFNEIPGNIRVPFVFIEFDTSKAQQGPSIQEYKVLAIGQKLSSGTKPPLQLDRITSESQAREFYGAGSILAGMMASYLKNNKVTEITAIAQEDDPGSVAAQGNITFTGAATESGTLFFYAGGRRYTVAIDEGNLASEVASLLQAEIQEDEDRRVETSIDPGTPEKVDFIARNKGALGNEIDLRVNFYTGEEAPEGLTTTMTPLSGGTSNPDLFEVISVLPETQYNIIIMPYSDAANLTVLETELKDRFGPIRQNDGVAFVGKRDTMGGLTTLGESRNSPHVSILGIAGPSSPWEWAGAVAGQVALSAQNDPARPFQTLELSGILPPSEKEQLLLEERNMLLYDGISTYRVDSGGVVRIERLITTYKTNAHGASDISLLDVNSLLTLSYLRYDLRTHLLNRFPNFKLADDGTRFGPGQAIVTPKIAKSEVIAKARQWEEKGLVENIDQLKRDLVVERDAANPNQLNILVSPDLINQLMTTGVQIGFLL